MLKRLSPMLVVAQVVAMLLAFTPMAFAATETSHSYSNQAIYGNLSVSGTTSLTGALTLGTPLAGSNVTNAARRFRITVPLSPVTGAAADSTTYRALIPVGRACTVTGVSFVAQTPPVSGTDTLKALKGSSSGNTLLSAASIDATGLAANTTTNATLTSTAADLAIPATTPIYLEYAQGSAGTDAIGVFGSVEVQVTDY